MLPQAIYDIAEICAQIGIADAVISPGSRNAPLTIAFARHSKINAYSVTDERSAGFIGLGLSQQSKAPTVLVCTSGSAGLNYGPAIAEAFFQQIPLIVITADRPQEWIGQWDGQTINQRNMFSNHVKASYDLPVAFDHPDSVWEANRKVAEAINLSTRSPGGPVHINIPLREPFYPVQNQKLEFNSAVKVIKNEPFERTIDPAGLESMRAELSNYSKVLIVGGQGSKDKGLEQTIEAIISKGIPVIGDIISNLHNVNGVLKNPDVFLKNSEDPNLQPDLLITFGKSIISKNLKLYLRKYKPKAHWHIGILESVPDTFQALTKHINMEPIHLLTKLLQGKTGTTEFFSHWQLVSKTTKYAQERFQFEGLTELSATKMVMSVLPDSASLQLANSMPVRLANFIGIENSNCEVFANRGTSGIDGCISTSVGGAIKNENLTVLLTGDVAFFYDRSAFWNKYVSRNLRIVLLNNNGGGIFRQIQGPNEQPELEEFFETEHNLTAELTAKEFNFEYQKVMNTKSLKSALSQFFEKSERPKILEIFTKKETNTIELKRFLRTINQ